MEKYQDTDLVGRCIYLGSSGGGGVTITKKKEAKAKNNIYKTGGPFGSDSSFDPSPSSEISPDIRSIFIYRIGKTI